MTRAERARAATWAAAWLAVAAAVYAFAVLTRTGQRLDALGLVLAYRGDRVHAWAALVRPALPALLGAAVVAYGVVAIAAGRRRVVLVTPVVVAAIAVLSPYLRDHVLPRPDLGDYAFTANSFPSTHMALTTALAWALVALRRSGGRRVPAWLAVTIGVVLLAEAAVNLLSFAHRPADLVGGLALATAVWYLVAAALGGWAVPGADA